MLPPRPRRRLAPLLGLLALSCGPGIEVRVPPARPAAPPPTRPAGPPRSFSSVDRNVLRAARRVVPLLEFLEAKTAVRLELDYFEDHEAQLEALVAGRSDFAWLSPTAYVLAAARAEVEPLVRPIQDSRATYRSLLLARADGAVASPADLRGKRVAFVRPESTSGNVFPRAYLAARGLEPDRDFAAWRYSGSHYKSLFLLARGEVDAAFVEDQNLDAALRELGLKHRVVEVVAAIPHGPIVAHARVPPAARAAMRRALLGYATDPTARELVMGMMQATGIESFKATADADYEDVRKHVRAAEVGR